MSEAADELKEDGLFEKKKKEKKSNNPWENNSPRTHPLVPIKAWIDAKTLNAFIKTEYEWSPTIFHWIWYCFVFAILFFFRAAAYMLYMVGVLTLSIGPLALIINSAIDKQPFAAVGFLFLGVIVWTLMYRLELFSGDWTKDRYYRGQF